MPLSREDRSLKDCWVPEMSVHLANKIDAASSQSGRKRKSPHALKSRRGRPPKYQYIWIQMAEEEKRRKQSMKEQDASVDLTKESGATPAGPRRESTRTPPDDICTTLKSERDV